MNSNVSENFPFVTHNGFFHADEVTAAAILQLGGIVSEVIRTDFANALEYEGRAIVGDIGRIYDHHRRIYDHHHTLLVRANGKPLATAGLIWKHYGYTVIDVVCGLTQSESGIRQLIWQHIDTNLIEGIDCIDADSQYEYSFSGNSGSVNVLTISDVIGRMNYPTPHDHEIQEHRFSKTSNIVSTVLHSMIQSAYKFYSGIDEIMEQSKYIEPDNVHTMVLPSKFEMDWDMFVGYIREHLPTCLFVIKTSNHPGAKYSMIALPKVADERPLICPIKRSTGFDGFIHLGQFIAGSDSMIDLIDLAKSNYVRFNGERQ